MAPTSRIADSTLTDAHVATLKAAGISVSTAINAGLRSVTHHEARDVCGIVYKSEHNGGLAFPYPDPTTEQTVRWRVRRDHTEVEADGAPIGKYLASPDRPRLYFAPDSFPRLDDPTVPVFVVEAEKSVLAITDASNTTHRNVLAIGTGGSWGWRGRIGKTEAPDGTRVDIKGVLPDFDLITWTDRDVVIIFDGDVTSNSSVKAARAKLAAELTSRGARVRVVNLPIEPGVNGPDDFIGRHGASAFMAQVDAAKPLTTPKATAKAERPKQGRDVAFDDIEPADEPVDGAALLETLVSTFRRYLALPDHAAVTMALWVMHAWCLAAAFCSPILALTSPAKRCGKTTALLVVGMLVPRRLFAANVTPAVLFRTIEKYEPTLLIDEADTFIRDNDELRGVLNSGHTKTTAVVIRAVGEDFDPRAFSTWCAKAIALIGKLPDTLHDRAIEVRMRRRLPGEAVSRLRQDRIEDETLPLRRQAARWAADHEQMLADADPMVPSGLNDRAADSWRPLLAIADVAGGDWPRLAREAAKALCAAESEDDTATMLLSDIRVIFADEDAMGSTALAKALVEMEDRPWAEWSQGRPLSAAKLTRLLTRHDVNAAGNIRIAGKVAKGYRREAFQDAWDRYLPAGKPLHRNNVNESGPEPAKQNRYTPDPCSGFETVTKPIATDECSGVAVSTPPQGNGGRRVAV